MINETILIKKSIRSDKLNLKKQKSNDRIIFVFKVYGFKRETARKESHRQYYFSLVHELLGAVSKNQWKK